MRNHRLFAFLLLFASAAIVAVPASADDLRQELKQYKGTGVVIRNFYRGTHLRFDSDGLPIGQPDLGTWTTDGIVSISDIRISKHGLEIKVRRAYAARNGKKFDLASSDRTADIVVGVDPEHTTLPQIQSVLRKIFLNPDDRFLDLVPDYWRPCFEYAAGLPVGTPFGCDFAPRLASLVGFDPPNAVSSTARSRSVSRETMGVYHVGDRVTAPRAAYTPDPPYSDAAREQRIEGTMALQLVVDSSGQTRDIVIVSPIGYGLDELAVEAVRTWKFEPARKDGQPVSVAINVEVAFHLG